MNEWIVHNIMEQHGHSPASFFKWLYSRLVRAYAAPLLSVILENICKVSRLAGFGGKTGTATTPALRHARKATVKSSEGGYTKSALSFYNETINGSDLRQAYSHRESQSSFLRTDHPLSNQPPIVVGPIRRFLLQVPHMSTIFEPFLPPNQRLRKKIAV
jgi:hypothetical protein